MSNERDDWANYRLFMAHKKALDMIFDRICTLPRTFHQDFHCSICGGPLPDQDPYNGYDTCEICLPRNRNADVAYDIERAADEEGVHVADYLKGPQS